MEASKAADKQIRIDTVTITGERWYRELSAMTNGVSVPFRTAARPQSLVRASVMSRGSEKSRERFDELMANCRDEEMSRVYACYSKVRHDLDSDPDPDEFF